MSYFQHRIFLGIDNKQGAFCTIKERENEVGIYNKRHHSKLGLHKRDINFHLSKATNSLGYSFWTYHLNKSEYLPLWLSFVNWILSHSNFIHECQYLHQCQCLNAGCQILLYQIRQSYQSFLQKKQEEQLLSQISLRD